MVCVYFLSSITAKEAEVQLLAERLREFQQALPEAQRRVGTQRDHLAVAQHELGEKRAALEDALRKYTSSEAELTKIKVLTAHSSVFMG